MFPPQPGNAYIPEDPSAPPIIWEMLQEPRLVCSVCGSHQVRYHEGFCEEHGAHLGPPKARIIHNYSVPKDRFPINKVSVCVPTT